MSFPIHKSSPCSPWPQRMLSLICVPCVCLLNAAGICCHVWYPVWSKIAFTVSAIRSKENFERAVVGEWVLCRSNSLKRASLAGFHRPPFSGFLSAKCSVKTVSVCVIWVVISCKTCRYSSQRNLWKGTIIKVFYQMTDQQNYAYEIFLTVFPDC